MSKEKLYAVKNDEGEYCSFDVDGFWELNGVIFPFTVSAAAVKNMVEDCGGHIVALIEEPKKVVLTKEQAEMVEKAHTISYPAYYISVISGKDEELLMNAYVNGYTVASKKKYYVKVFKNDFGYLNFNYVIDRAIASDREQRLGYRTQFTKSEIKQLEQRYDIPLDWDKVKLIEVEDDENY